MLATNSLPETGHGGSMWFPGQDKLWWGTATASVVASARTEQLTQAHQEILGLLADLPESEHKLSFSDLVVVHADQDKATGDVHPEVESPDHGSERRPAADHDRNVCQEPAAFDKEAKDGDLGASKRRSRRGGATSGSEQPVLLKPNRIGSGCSIVGEGVLLNMYMPSSLTRSLTTGSLSRSSRYSSATERPAASIATFSEEAQMAKFCCWSSIWATKCRGKHNTRGNSLSITGEKGKNNGHDKKKKKVQSARCASSEALV